MSPDEPAPVVGQRMDCGAPSRDYGPTPSRTFPDPAPALASLAQELARAREKFPDVRLALCALVEELGEAVRRRPAYAPGNREWLQVACCALRLYQEGDPAAAKDEGTRDPGCPLEWIESALRTLEQLGRRTMAEFYRDPRHAAEGGHAGVARAQDGVPPCPEDEAPGPGPGPGPPPPSPADLVPTAVKPGRRPGRLYVVLARRRLDQHAEEFVEVEDGWGRGVGPGAVPSAHEPATPVPGGTGGRRRVLEFEDPGLRECFRVHLQSAIDAYDHLARLAVGGMRERYRNLASGARQELARITETPESES